MAKERFMVGVLVMCLIYTVLPSERTEAERLVDGPNVKNIILMIGDGMGTSYTSAYRYFKDDPQTPAMEETVFDRHFVGMQHTYSVDDNENITDSAAAATALATGVKTYNGAISVDVHQRRVPTVLEQAKANGKATGVVVTAPINHATPAAFIAHHPSRNQYHAIADQYYDDRIDGQLKVDILLGGGRQYFERRERNVAKQFEQAGYRYVTTREQLLSDDHSKLLGLFAANGMPHALDRPHTVPSLTEMTTTAIERLATHKSGFFLVVEGSQIDWAGHHNDMVSAMVELDDFAEAVEAAIRFARQDGETLVIITADHSTGGLTIGKDGKYRWDPTPLYRATRTPDFMAQRILSGHSVHATLHEFGGIALKPSELINVTAAARLGQEALIRAIASVYNERSRTGWTTTAHTGEDVPVFAYGPGKQLFSGLLDNSDIAKNMFKILSSSR